MSYGRGPPKTEGMTSLKVDNLTFRTRPDDIRELFEKYGDVGDVYVPRDRFTKESRGFAFVRFYDKRDAEDAMDDMDGHMMDGRELRVQMARYGRPTNSARHDNRRDDNNSRDYGRRDNYQSRGRGGYNNYNRRNRSRSISRDRDRHSRRRRSYSRSRSRSRSRSGSKSRSRSGSQLRQTRSRSPSRSPSKSPRPDGSPFVGDKD